MKRCNQCSQIKSLAAFSPGQTQCRECRAANAREKYKSPVEAEAIRERVRKGNESLRAAVFAHYGRACACCGTTENLSIDHVKGGGKIHREQLANGGRGGHGGKFYRWLIKNGFPAGYQTLCMPCNASKKEGAQCNLDHGQEVKAA